MAAEDGALPLQALIAELCALTGAAATVAELDRGVVSTFGELPPGRVDGEGSHEGVGRLLKRHRVVEHRGRRWRISAVQGAGAHAAAERDRLRFAAIVEHQTEWVVRQRPDGRYTYVNPAFCLSMGKTAAQLQSPEHDCLALLDEGSRAHLLANRARLTPAQPTVLTEHPYTLPDGSVRWESWTETAIFDADGTVLEFQCVGRDVTDRVLAEQALKASEARYRNVVESQTDLITRVRPDGRATFVNDAYCRYMGMTRAQLLDEGWDDLSTLSLVDRAAVLAQWGALTPSSPNWSHETEVALPDGTRHIELWRQQGIFDAEGRLIEVQGVGRDITEQRRAERALQESEERYRAVVEDLTELIGRYDRDFKLTFTNGVHARLAGVPVEALQGRDFFADVPERLARSLRQRLLALTPERPTDIAENEKVLPDGTQRWFHWTNRALFDARRALTGYQAVGHDITDLKRTEAALREREALLRAIIDTQSEWVTRQDLDNRFTFVNPAYCRYMGLSAEQLCDGGFDDYASVRPDDRERFSALRAAMTPQRPTFAIELQARHPDGSLRIEEWTETAIFDDAGRLLGYQAVGRDLSAQRAAEDEVRRQRERLLQQEKLAALGSLLAGVAHELNNPLSVVVGYAALMREDARDRVVRDRAKEIHTAAQRCARIVSTFLDMARQKPPAFGPVAVGRSIDEALEIVAYPLRSGGVTVTRRIPANLPAVRADADQLHQVVTNLLINAQQALATCPEPRNIEITAVVMDGMVELAIADNGPGIPAELRRRVFEPFFTTKPQGVGTGLGLAVCHGILASHQGSIELDPAPGGGTVARIRLPVTASTRRRAPRSLPKAPGMVLLVDDEPAIVAVVGEALRRDGHIVHGVADGRAALERVAHERVDLVITDLRMPGMDGISLLDALHRVEPRLADGALILTGDTLRAGSDPALAGYGDRLIEKPVDLASLRRRVRRSLGRRQP